MLRMLSTTGLGVAATLALATEGVAMDSKAFDERLRQVMSHCGRPGYVLKPTPGKRLIITARPEIRQTPLSDAEMTCIEREVRKIGWKLAAGHKH